MNDKDIAEFKFSANFNGLAMLTAPKITTDYKMFPDGANSKSTMQKN